MIKFSQRVEETKCKTNLIVKHKSRKIFQHGVLCIKRLKHNDFLSMILQNVKGSLFNVLYFLLGAISPFVAATLYIHTMDIFYWFEKHLWSN